MKEKLGLKNLHSVIAALFAISTLLILPIIFKTNYKDLFNIKYAYYYVTALIAIGSFLSVQIVLFCRGRIGWETFGVWEITLFIFVSICIVSTLQSDFVYESFWGNEGRFNGLFLMLLYCTTTYFVGRYLKMKQWYMDLFLIAGILVVLLGLGDYLDLDLLNFKVGIPREDPGYMVFTSTVGNINFYSSYVAMILGCAGGAFCIEKGRARTLFYYICYVFAFAGVITGNSDSGYLAIMAILGFLPLYCLKRWASIKRYVLLLAASVSLIQLIGWANETWSERLIVLDSLLSRLAGTGALAVAVILWGFTIYLYVRSNRSEDRSLPASWYYIWLGILVFMGLCLLFVLCDVNLAGNVERYGSLENYLHFDDGWGTRRGYVWRVAWEHFSGFSLLHKLFGYGLETFPILAIYNNKWEMIYVYGDYYDSVHNEYLQYLLGIGVVGTIAYVSFLGTAIVRLINNIKKNHFLLGILMGLVAYLVQAVVNISTVNVAAVMWMLIAIGMAGCRKAGESEDSQEQMILGEE